MIKQHASRLLVNFIIPFSHLTPQQYGTTANTDNHYKSLTNFIYAYQSTCDIDPALVEKIKQFRFAKYSSGNAAFVCKQESMLPWERDTHVG